MDYFRVGLILRPHGVQGGVRLQPLSDDMARFRELREAYLEREDAYEPVLVSQVALQPDAVLLHLSACTNREEAEALRGVYLCVDRAHACKLPEGRYFVADLIGCAVSDTAGTAHGTLTDVLETGANDVYVIEGARRLLAPALKKLLVQVDTEKKRILLDADVLGEVGLFED